MNKSIITRVGMSAAILIGVALGPVTASGAAEVTGQVTVNVDPGTTPVPPLAAPALPIPGGSAPALPIPGGSAPALPIPGGDAPALPGVPTDGGANGLPVPELPVPTGGAGDGGLPTSPAAIAGALAAVPGVPAALGALSQVPGGTAVLGALATLPTVLASQSGLMGTLPFTGLGSGALAAGGLGILGAGFAIRGLLRRLGLTG